jgi:hypothetical protein
MEKTRKVARIRNRLAPEIEEAILAYSLEQPITTNSFYT